LVGTLTIGEKNGKRFGRITSWNFTLYKKSYTKVSIIQIHLFKIVEFD
jgi:hypothetical protein